VRRGRGEGDGPLPLNTVVLLQKASELCGLSPGEAMMQAEQLYLKGFLSYPRTETTRYPQHFDKWGVLEQLKVPDAPFSGLAHKVAELKIDGRTDGVDVGDHPPITPVKHATERQCKEPAAWELYKLVCRHFLATVSPDCMVNEVEVKLDLGGVPMAVKSKRQVQGTFNWTHVTGTEVKDDGPSGLENIKPGTRLAVSDTDLKQSASTVPEQLKESDLLALMEEHGVGTDATMAHHISNVISRSYVKLDKETRKLAPTGLGLALIHAYTLIDPGLVQPTVRAAIENAVNRVATGHAQKHEVVQQAVQIFQKKFQLFKGRADRVPMMLAMAYTKDRKAVQGKAANVLAQWDYAQKHMAAIQLEHLLGARGGVSLQDADEKAPPMAPGLSVRIHGLKAAPQLNDMMAVVDHLNAENGRWHVRMVSGEVKALKPDNLSPVVNPFSQCACTA